MRIKKVGAMPGNLTYILILTSFFLLFGTAVFSMVNINKANPEVMGGEFVGVIVGSACFSENKKMGEVEEELFTNQKLKECLLEMDTDDVSMKLEIGENSAPIYINEVEYNKQEKNCNLDFDEQKCYNKEVFQYYKKKGKELKYIMTEMEELKISIIFS